MSTERQHSLVQQVTTDQEHAAPEATICAERLRAERREKVYNMQ